jgi:cob(I)alamin adenosyltransferase
MKLYTKTGDAGKTALFGGKRILKSDLQLEAYGTIDELSSTLGWVAVSLDDDDVGFLTHIQKELYAIMAVLAGSDQTVLDHLKESTQTLEQKIDALTRSLPEITDFILPQGSEACTRLHIARTVCRRAERAVVNWHAHSDHATEEKKIIAQYILPYLNRLSDYLFMLARSYTSYDVAAKP